MLNKSLFTSASPEWYTPPELVKDIVAFLGEIDLDPCADPEHRIPARVHYTEHGLARPWGYARIYMNPPYGRQIGDWVNQALHAPLVATSIVMLLPARTDARWFQPLFDQCSLCFIKGRLKFSGCKNSAPFPSVLAYRGIHHHHFYHSFMRWGKTVVAL